MNIVGQLDLLQKNYLARYTALFNSGMLSEEFFQLLISKIFKAKEGAIDGLGLCNRWSNILKVCLNDIAPYMAKNLHMIGSGKGLRDKIDRFARSQYIKINPVSRKEKSSSNFPHLFSLLSIQDKLTKEQLEDPNLVVPASWKWDLRYPMSCLLSLCCHHSWQGLSVVTSKEPKTKSRAMMKVENRKKKRLEFVNSTQKEISQNRKKAKAKDQWKLVKTLNESDGMRTLRRGVVMDLWSKQAEVLRATIEIQMRIGKDEKKTQLLVEKLVEHTMAKPACPKTPPEIKNAARNVISLLNSDDDDDEKPPAKQLFPTSNGDAKMESPSLNKKQKEGVSNEKGVSFDNLSLKGRYDFAKTIADTMVDTVLHFMGDKFNELETSSSSSESTLASKKTDGRMNMISSLALQRMEEDDKNGNVAAL